MNKYVYIIDGPHLLQRYQHVQQHMTANVLVGHELRTIDTTIITLALKNIVKLSECGKHPVAVCFGNKTKIRQQYFAIPKKFGFKYKNEKLQNWGPIGEAQKWFKSILLQANMAVGDDEECSTADEIVAMVNTAKKQYPDHKILVITGNSYLAPLVDEQVSVYKHGIYTLHDDGYPELLKKIQITNNNWPKALSFITEYKSYEVPYNLALLVYIFRGDKRFGIPAMHGFTPTKVREILNNLKGESLLYESGSLIAGTRDYTDSNSLKAIYPRLAALLTQDELNEVVFRYRGLNLNGPIVSPLATRFPLTDKQINQFDYLALQDAASKLLIQL